MASALALVAATAATEGAEVAVAVAPSSGAVVVSLRPRLPVLCECCGDRGWVWEGDEEREEAVDCPACGGTCGVVDVLEEHALDAATAADEWLDEQRWEEVA